VRRALQGRLQRLEGSGAAAPPVVLILGDREEDLARQAAEMRADGRLTEDALVIRVQFVKPTNPQGGVDEPLP
jgi:hypothetical protein